MTTDRARVRRVPGSRPQAGDCAGRRPGPLPSGAPWTRPLASGAPEARTALALWALPAAAHVVEPGAVRGACGAVRGSSRPGQCNPVWRAPRTGPHVSSPGRREATLGGPALPRACYAPWRPPWGRALGTRGSLSGPPFPGSGLAAGGGSSPFALPGRAPRAAPFPTQPPASPATPGSPFATPPCVKVPTLGALGGRDLLSPRCAPPATSRLSRTL